MKSKIIKSILFSTIGVLSTSAITPMVLTSCVKKKQTIPVTGVTLDKSSLKLAPGKNTQLIATVLPENATNKNVAWNSSDESIATVDQNGNIKAISEGNTTITVITEDGGYTDICLVTVTKKIIPVNSVALDKNKLELAKGGIGQLTATVLPKNATNKSIAWSSSNSSIATVDENGNVTAKAIGNATVKVTTEDGGYTSACLVTIFEKIIPVNSVTLDKGRLGLNEGGTAKLIASVLPENATNKNVTWSSSDPSIATVDQNGNVKVFNEGTATVTVTTEDGNKSSACLVTVSTNPTPVVVGMDYGTWGNIKVKCKLLSNYECRLLTKFNGEDSENGYVEGAGVLRIPDHVVYNGENYYVKRIPSEWSDGENDVYGIEFDNVSHLKEICDYAFKGTDALDNYHLKVLTFPEGLEYIGTEAFYNVDRSYDNVMYGIDFPSTLNAINVRAFANAGYIGNGSHPATLMFRGNFNTANMCEKVFYNSSSRHYVQYIYAPVMEIATNIANHIRVCYEDDFTINKNSLIPKVIGE